MKKSNVITLEFMTDLRNAIYSTVNQNKKLSEIKKETLKNFILKESSDYEILYFAMKGDLPKEKYNAAKENKLFENLKMNIIKNKKVVKKFLTKEAFYDLFLMESLQPYGLSSNKLILEFKMNNIIKEDTLSNIINSAKEYIAKVGSSEASNEANEAKANIAKKVIEKARKLEEENNTLKHRLRDIGNSDRSSLLEKLKQNEDQMKNLSFMWKKTMKDTFERGMGAAKEVGKNMADKAHQMIDQASGSNVATQLASKLHTSGGTAAGIIGISGLVLAGLIAYASRKTYTNFFSAAAKACQGKKGNEKEICMKNFHKKGLEAQYRDLQSALKVCQDSKDPRSCSKAITEKLYKIKKQLSGLK